MSPSDETSIQNTAKKEREELISFKYILGDMGIAILVAIANGARTKDSILMLSGTPLACISGRMPVLLNLKLVVNLSPEEFIITKRGMQFLKCINEPS